MGLEREMGLAQGARVGKRLGQGHVGGVGAYGGKLGEKGQNVCAHESILHSRDRNDPRFLLSHSLSGKYV